VIGADGSEEYTLVDDAGQTERIRVDVGGYRKMEDPDTEMKIDELTDRWKTTLCIKRCILILEVWLFGRFVAILRMRPITWLKARARSRCPIQPGGCIRLRGTPGLEWPSPSPDNTDAVFMAVDEDGRAIDGSDGIRDSIVNPMWEVVARKNGPHFSAAEEEKVQ
jgi:hypothetical protein